MDRKVHGWNKLNDINIMLKYLYMSENHSVEYQNAIDIRFSLKMTDDLSLIKTMINGAAPGQQFDGDDLSISDLSAIVEQLMGSPAVEFPNNFSNRFEEIKNIVITSIALTDMKKNRSD